MVLSLVVIGVVVARHLRLHPARRPRPTRSSRSTTASSCSRPGAPRRTRWPRPEGLSARTGARPRSRYSGADPHEAAGTWASSTPSEQYVAVEQTTVTAGPFIAEVTPARDGRPTVTQRVEGRTWDALRRASSTTRWCARSKGVTTVVTGTALDEPARRRWRPRSKASQARARPRPRRRRRAARRARSAAQTVVTTSS